MRILLFVTLSCLAAMPIPSVSSQAVWAATALKQDEHTLVRFSGEVSRGQTFQKEVGENLLFRLVPDEFGWVMSVTSKTNPEEDFLWVASPPYRLDNPRYLGTAYGHSAKEAASWSPRSFHFVLDEASYHKASDAVQRLLWPYSHTESELAEADQALAEMSTGSGDLRIIEARFGGLKPGEKSWLQHIKFDVVIHLPVESR